MREKRRRGREKRNEGVERKELEGILGEEGVRGRQRREKKWRYKETVERERGGGVGMERSFEESRGRI